MEQTLRSGKGLIGFGTVGYAVMTLTTSLQRGELLAPFVAVSTATVLIHITRIYIYYVTTRLEMMT